MSARSVRVAAALLILNAAAAAKVGDASSVAATLERLGYENVAAAVRGDTTSVWCENRRVRFTAAWIMGALAIAARETDETAVEVVAERVGQPIVTVEARASDVRKWMSGALTSQAFAGLVNIRYAGGQQVPARHNASFGRTDLVLAPGRLSSEFGDPVSWIRADFDMSAALETELAPGVMAYARVLVPLAHRGAPVANEYRYNEIRPGSMLVAYLRPMGRTGFATVAAGYFELGAWQYDSYGFAADFEQSSADGLWTVGATIGYVGQAIYRVINDPKQNRRYRSLTIVWPPRNVPYEFSVGRHFRSVDLTLTARWGRYIMGDRAWRVDAERRFGEVAVTVFGIKSDDRLGGADPVDRNNVRLLGGIRIEVPLYPRVRRMPSRFRVTAADTYAWTYRYRLGDVGVALDTYHDVSELIGDYNPQEILHNLDRVRAQLRTSGEWEERNRPGATAPN